MTGAGGDADALMTRGMARGTPLDEFGPVWDSARLRLARAAWQASSLDPFLSYEVPYTGTSSGRLSADAADVALAAFRAAGRTGGMRIVELGSGSGVFARLFLRRLQEVAPEVLAESRYLVTDGSAAMLAAQEASGVLAPWERQVERRVLDISSAAPLPGPFDVVLATYVLDSLPFDLLAVNGDRVWRREVQTFHPTDPGAAAAIRAALDAGDMAALGALAPEGRRLVMRTRYAAIDRRDLPRAELLPSGPGGETLPLVHAHGAADCLDRIADALAPGGVAIFSDYGHGAPMEGHESPEFQGFGASVAAPLNFTQMAAAMALRTDVRLLAPAEEDGAILTRVLVKGAADGEIAALVDDRYGALRHRAMTAPVEAARTYLRSRMFETSRGLYRRALELRPGDWSLLEEIAMLLLMPAGEAEAAAEMAKAGLELNPLSPGLWRVRAEAELAQEKLGAAHDTIRHAVRLAPRNYGCQRVLGEVELARKDFAAALAAVAVALTHDRENEEREETLALQARILAAINEDQRGVLLAYANQFRADDLKLPE